MCCASLCGTVCSIGRIQLIRWVFNLFAQAGFIHCNQACLLWVCTRCVKLTEISIQNYTLLQIEKKQNFSKFFFNSICSSEVKATENLFNLLLLQSKFYCFALVLKTLTRRVLLAVLPFLSNLPLAMMPAHRLRAQGLGMSDRRQG
jgi:hypothetical protein